MSADHEGTAAPDDLLDRAPDSPENPHAGFGAVVLDIGGDVGALVVVMPDSLVGEEVDIAPADGAVTVAPDHDHDHDHDHGHGHGHGHGHRAHVAVIRRPMAGRLVPSLVYPELVAGTYRLYPKGTDDAMITVEVRGAEVTEARWPGC